MSCFANSLGMLYAHWNSDSLARHANEQIVCTCTYITHITTAQLEMFMMLHGGDQKTTYLLSFHTSHGGGSPPPHTHTHTHPAQGPTKPPSGNLVPYCYVVLFLHPLQRRNLFWLANYFLLNTVDRTACTTTQDYWTELLH